MSRNTDSPVTNLVLFGNNKTTSPDEQADMQQTMEATQLRTPPTSPPNTPQRKTVQHGNPTESAGNPTFTFISLKDTLGLDKPICGSPTKTGEPCGHKTGKVKLAHASDQLANMIGIAPGSPAFETGLESLVRAVHCYRHDSSRLLSLRVKNWMAIFSPANSQGRELQFLIDELRKTLEFHEPKCLCCGWGIGGQKVENCRKTVDKICGLAADSGKALVILYLLRVLRFNRLCPNHDKVKVEETTEWTATVLNMLDKHHTKSSREAESSDPSLQTDLAGESQTLNNCSMSASTEETEPTPEPHTQPTVHNSLQPTTGTHQPLEEEQTVTIEKTLETSFNKLSLGPKEISSNNNPRGSLEQPLESKPSSTTSVTLSEPFEDQNDDLRAYWPLVFDKSRLQTKRFDYKLDNRLSALQKARKVACEPLMTAMRDSGFVYVYQVEDNDDYVKIGWTRSSTDLRRQQWEFDCNRGTTILYPDAPDPVAVANARRVEDLCHAELGHLRFKVDCQGCMKWHQEWFKVSVEGAVKVVQKWSGWMAAEPYELLEGASEEQWTLKPEEEDRLAVMTS